VPYGSVSYTCNPPFASQSCNQNFLPILRYSHTMAAHVALWVCAAVAIAVIAYAAHEHTKQKNRSPALSTSARTRPSTHTTPIPMESFTKEGPVARPSSDAAVSVSTPSCTHSC
jgi:hypothetical protein